MVMKTYKFLFGLVLLCSLIPSGLIAFKITYSNIDIVVAQVEIHHSTIAWSPNQEKIATGMSNGTVNIWSSQNSQILASLTGHTGRINDLAWDGNSNYLASAGEDGMIQVWDISTETLLFPPLVHNGVVTSVIWSLDNTKIISIDPTGVDNLYIWDATTGLSINTLATGGLLQMKFSPNGSLLALANPVGIIAFRDGATYEFISDHIQYPEGVGDGFDVYTIDWNSDGSQIVGGSLNGVVRTWDTTTYGMLLDLQGSNSQDVSFTTTLIQDVMFSPDDARIASISADGVLRIWDSSNGAVLTEMQLSQLVNAARFSPDGTQLAYGGDETSFAIVNVPQGTITCDHNIPSSDTATLISTITTANGSGNPTTICLAQDSTYTFTTANNYLNALPYITGDITIEGNNATLTRSGTEAFRFFEVDTGGKLTLNDLTLSNGDVTGETERGGALMNDGGETVLNNVTFDGNSGNTGGAIDNEEGTLTINDSTFTNNNGFYGGAIDNDDVATLTISGSTFTTNHAFADGGAIHNDGGTLAVSDTTFTTNTADDYGGGIDNDDGDVTINASTFTSNSSDGGGAIRNDGTLTINAGTAFNNNAANNLGWGGAIYNKSGTTLIINATSFSGNTANLEGGAIRNQGNLTVNTGSTFDGNSGVQYGGAIYNTGGTVNLTGVELMNNTATNLDAGAIYSNSSGSLTLTDSILSGNDSGRRGGGIWASGTAILTNVSITNNTAVVEGGGVYGSSSATISSGNGCITGNSSRAVYSASSTPQNFENNWWGATDGPGGSGSGSGDAVNSNIDYTPFITTACPLP